MNRTTPLVRPLVVATFAAAVALSPPAIAVGAYQPARTAPQSVQLGSGSSNCGPESVQDGDGVLVAYGERPDGQGTRIQVRRWTPTLGWGEPTQVSAEPLDGCSDLGLASDGNAAIVAWDAGLYETQSVVDSAMQAAVRPSADQGWTPASALLSVSEDDFMDPAGDSVYLRSVVVAEGVPMVAGLRVPAQHGEKTVWSRVWTAGVWQPETAIMTVAAQDIAETVDLYPQPGGAMAMIGVNPGGRGGVLLGAAWTPASSWQAPVHSVSDSRCYDHPEVSAARRIVVVWSCKADGRMHLWAKEWTGQGWTGFAAVTPPGLNVNWLGYAIAQSDGTVAVAFQQVRGTAATVATARSRAVGRWTPPTRIAESKVEVIGLAVAVSRNDTVVAWADAPTLLDDQRRPSKKSLLARVVPARGTPGPVVTLVSGIRNLSPEGVGSTGGVAFQWWRSDERDGGMSLATWSRPGGWTRPFATGPVEWRPQLLATAGHAVMTWSAPTSTTAVTAPW